MSGSIKASEIRSFFNDVFRLINCPKELSEPVIDGLIETSLRGVDSHGIRLMPHYVRAARNGRINLAPIFAFTETSATTAVLDADHTFGITAARLAMDKAMAMARVYGMGCVAVANSSHFGAAAIYGLQAARNNMIGIGSTSVDALVLPYGAKEKALGTNPICFAAPCEGEEPFCLDMATSVISWNKLRQHRESGLRLEPGWAADADGKTCLDPDKASSLMPIGGYKGYGLAIVVEILCALLTGMPFGRHISRMYPLTAEKRCLGHFLMAIDISRFQEIDYFKGRLKEMIDELRGLVPAEGTDKVRVANDPEKEKSEKRQKEGIPVSRLELASFREIAKEIGLTGTGHQAILGRK